LWDTLNLFDIKYKNKDKIALWFVPAEACLKPISFQEIKWKQKLSARRSLQYEHSRGYVREALSYIFGIPPLNIPIVSPPGLPPKLPTEMGYVSFSHCKDGLLIGWSIKNLGVDIERQDRFFLAEKLINKFFSDNERKLLKVFKGNKFNKEVLKLWVRKEAAIKWQRGSVFTDLSKWILNLCTNKIENQIDGHNLRSFFISHENWYISIASDINSIKENPIICRYN